MLVAENDSQSQWHNRSIYQTSRLAGLGLHWLKIDPLQNQYRTGFVAASLVPFPFDNMAPVQAEHKLHFVSNR